MARVKRSQAAHQPDQPPAIVGAGQLAGPAGPPTTSPGPPSGAYLQPPAPDPRSTIRSLQIALGVVSVLAVCLAIAVVFLALRPQPTAGTTPTQSASVQPSATPTPVFFDHYVEVSPGRAGADAIIIEIHTDYRCPWCGRFEAIYGQALYDLSQTGDVDLRIHLRTSIGKESSQRASIGALCAERAGAFWAYHTAIFTNQSLAGADGFTDAQLRVEFAGQAGLTGDALTQFQACYDNRLTEAEVTQMETEGVQGAVNSTPTTFVNGIQMIFNLQSDDTSQAPQSVTAASLLSILKNAIDQ